MMFKKVKSLLSLLICISVLCTVMPITSYAADAAENVASVTFNGNTEYYTTIDDAWNAAVALDTTAENKATIQLLNDCTAENTLTNTEDYLVLNTNAKTLTTPSALYPETTIRCGIGVDGGSLEIIGNGTITGVSRSDYSRALLLINGGKVYADGITLHNTGLNGSNVVRINGGEFYLLDGQLIADEEYALYVSGGKVYLYSGKLSTTGRMTVVNDENSNIQICYSEKPLYFIDDTNLNWYIIENDSAIHLEDNLVMDLEYSDNPDGSDSKMLRNVTRIDNIANEGKKYLKIQTYKPSYLFSTNYNNQLLNKIRNDKITETSDDAYTAVHFVNLADYDLTDIPYSDYSANGDGSVKAWVTGTELYIGGYEKIIAGKSLFRAFMGGYKINKITGLEMLDTSNVTNMADMFYACGSESTVFTLDLGDNFDTSKVKDMTYMFCNCGKNSTKFALDLGDNFDTSNVTKMNSMFSGCGYSSPTFTLDLGAKFDTSKVTNMYLMFDCCGFNSTAFTTLDLSTFTVNADTEIGWFANKIPVTKFIFGKGWRNAALPVKYPFANCSSSTPTEIVGATKNLLSYKWTRDNRIVTFTDNITYEIIPITENGGWATEGGTVTGGGTVLDGESITLTATANEGYSFDGWYDGDTKVCDTAEFVVEDAAEDKTYTAKFAKAIVYYTVSAESGTEGGTVSGGGEVADGGNITLTATANEGYTFDGWYDGDTKVCDTTEFVVENITTDKTYTAKFIKNLPTRSNLFSMSASSSSLISKINRDGVTNIDSNEITAVHFVDLADYDLTNIPYSDYSATGDGSVKAWMDGTELYIGGYGKIIAGKSLAFAFMNGVKIDKITGLEMLDTSNVTDMEYMFYACGLYSQVLTLDLGNNFDTSNVTKMGSMFYNCGYKSTAFTLNLGDKFDTSNVTDMSSMFTACGGKSNVFTLDLGNKFDTSKVTNMKEMFQYCGASAKSFTLNLGDKFDTSNVTDMGLMFHNCGSASTVFTLDLGNKFDTSNVTDMNFMFGFCGRNSSVFNLDLGDKFNTSKAANMEGMFYSCGYKSSAFTTLDLSKFTIGANTKLDKFAYGSNVKTFIFGDGWANASLPSAGSEKGAFYAYSQISTTVTGATEKLLNYDWASDNRIVNGLKPQTYTVTANAETGGTVSGGSEVTEGESVTLTATANDGYTFAGWYDGDTKVCDTAEFVVTNVTANITYTAKFTKNQIVEPDPEPEEPEIPYLKWDGSTLTLVKKASAKCRVGIVYVGGATFDTNNINWDELVAAGKDYANLNSPVGYAIYGNFTKRTPGTRGNYVAFVKYTKEDGTTTADYITFNVKNAVSFERPSLSYNPKTRTLKMKGNVSSTIGVAYIGESEVDASNITWNDFVKVGKLYPDENGSSGYTKVLNTLDYTKTFNTNGNYVAFIKYFDGNLNKSLAKYYTFTVDDYNLQPTDIPFALAEESQIILNTNGFDVAKVTIVYIGTDDVSITNWNEFSAAAAKFSDINGKELNQQYTNPKDGSVWKQKTAGWYGVYIRYNIDGERCNSYCTVEVK